MSAPRNGVLAIAAVLLGLSVASGAAQAQPYNLSTGVGDGSVTVGVDGYGAFGSSPGPDSADAIFDPIGPPGPIVGGSIFESGIALRIGAVGPRAILSSGTIGGSGGLPKATVTGTATTGTSSFLDPSGTLSFSLVQTIAPSFNGAAQTGSVLTQTYTITNISAGPLTFELCRYVDTQRNVYNGGHFFAANGIEILNADENPINPLVVGISGIGGTPLDSNRFEIKAFPTTRTDILTGLAFNDTVAGGPPFNVTMGLRNVFTVGPGASTVYTAHTVWGNGPAANTIFPNPTPAPAPAPGILYGCNWTGNQLFTISTTPTAGIGLGTLVGPLPAGVVPAGLAFRGNNLHVYDQLGDRIRQVDPTSGASLGIYDPNITGVFGEGDIAFRSDGIGFLAPGAPAKLYRFDITVPASGVLINAALAPVMDGFAFDKTDVLYGLAEGGGGLYTIDQATGATTLIGATGIPAGLTFGGLAFDSSGNLFGAVGGGGGSFLYQINPSTGAATLVGAIGFTEVSGLRFMKGSTPGNGEGTYVGCKGPPVAVELPPGEGVFGFGGMKEAPKLRLPVLRGPVWDGAANFHVFNVAHQQAHAEPDADAGVALFGWGLLSMLALGLLAHFGAKYRTS